MAECYMNLDSFSNFPMNKEVYEGAIRVPIAVPSFLYACRRRDVLWDPLGVRAGRRRPILCPEHISKTILVMVMKFSGWIDQIKGECSAHEP